MSSEEPEPISKTEEAIEVPFSDIPFQENRAETKVNEAVAVAEEAEIAKAGEEVDAEAKVEELEENANAEVVVDEKAESNTNASPTQLFNGFNINLFVQLGDTIRIKSNKYRSVGNNINGIVYYRSHELLRVKPFGLSILYDFTFKDDDAEEIYDDEYGVSEVNIIEKRGYGSFVEQQNFSINQTIEAVDITDENSDTTRYVIKEVNKEKDFIIVETSDGERETIEFNFIGIDPDASFQIIREIIPEGAQKSEQDVVEGEEEEEEPIIEEIVEFVGAIDVTLPQVYRDAEVFEQNIPDMLQKVDAINDFMLELTEKEQNDPKKIRAIRILVETLFNLKQATVAYNTDGTRKGIKAVSASTLMDLIDNVKVPLGRPVLNAKKKLYVEYEDESDNTDSVFTREFETELDQLILGKEGMVATTGVREWSNQKKFLNDFLSPWTQIDEDYEDSGDYLWSAIADSDFFREIPPELDEDNMFEQELEGYIASHDKEAGPILDTVPFGLERALSTVYRKGKDRKEVFFPEESSTVNSYLLFPLDAAPYLGAVRCNLLAVDSGLSHLPRKTMKMLLREFGSPTEMGTSKNIQLFNPSSDTIGNIPLDNYIDGLPIISLTINDTFYVLQQYGINDIEINIPLYTVLNKKITRHQKKFISTIATMRQKLDEIKDPEENPYIELSFIADIQRERILKDEIENFKKFNPAHITSDIALLTYIIKKYPNYVQVVVGKNAELIARAKQDSYLTNYLLHEKIRRLTDENAPYSKPSPNTCKHVGTLTTIRRKYDDVERMKDLAVFFKKYQGKRTENWIDCSVCNLHLLCIHERLQIQSFLNPVEKTSIDKDIILKFAGGQFQGKYICRNCGQQIREFEFESNMEFDDQGRPKTGNAQLDDEDEEIEDKLDALISVPLDKSERKLLELNTEDEVTYYKVIRELSYFLKVELKQEQIKNIIDNVVYYIQNKARSEERYAALLLKVPTSPPYSVYISRTIVGVSAVYLLIEIQCSIPGFNVRAKIDEKVYTMSGYPLDTSPENKESIYYMSYALISCMKNTYPWDKTAILSLKEDQRINFVMRLLDTTITAVISNNMIQQMLHQKRRYIANKDLQQKHIEVLPASFLPEQILISNENVIVPEVAPVNNVKSRIALVNYWIRKAHLTALDSASLIRGSTVSETTCCTKNIVEPQSIWESDEFASIPMAKRLLAPKMVNMLLTRYKDRKSNSEMIEPDKELYFRLFLKCCFRGPRTGYVHEPGLTYKCTWCEFQFPGNPNCMDTNTEGKAAISESNVEIDKGTFYDLLDELHRNNQVDPVHVMEVTSLAEVLDDFANVEDQVTDDWDQVIEESFTKYLALPVDADKGDELLALSNIAHTTNLKYDTVGRKVSEKYMQLLISITELSWGNFFDVIQIYFIVYFQRMISGFSAESLAIPEELKLVFSVTHVEKDLTDIVKGEYGYARNKSSFSKLDDIYTKLQNELIGTLGRKAKASRANVDENYSKIVKRISRFIAILSGLLAFKSKINFRKMRDSTMLLDYIKKLILFGSLATLIETNNNVLIELIYAQLDKFNKEKLSYSPEEIKNMIAVRDEKERVHVVKEFDVLSDEERQIEKVKKILGIGKWAVGGTKLIYAYDKDYYDLERQRRLDAGIIDFPGLGDDDMAQGRPVDELGFAIEGDVDGYDFDQHADEADE